MKFIQNKLVKKHLLVMLGCIVLITAGMVGLYAYSPLTSKIYRAPFTRNLIAPHLPEQVGTVDLGHNSFYIAGLDENTIYLGNHTRPLLLVTIDRKSMKLKKNTITVTGLDSIRDANYFHLTVTPKYFYLAHGIIPTILRGETGNWKASPLKINKGDYFDQAVPIGPSSFGLRYYSNKQQGYSIGKKDIDKNLSFESNHELLEKQGDGVFSVDGKLLYNDQLNTLIYLYAYRNQYILVDSTLKLISRGNTIDTFAHAKIKIAEVSAGQTMTAAPVAVINKASATYGDLLFIESNILAQNEDQNRFMQASVIDVYQISNKKYQYSFYASNDENKKISDLRIFKNTLVTVADRHLYVYNLDNLQ